MARKDTQDGNEDTDGLPAVDKLFGDDGADLDISGDRGDEVTPPAEPDPDDLVVDPKADDDKPKADDDKPKADDDKPKADDDKPKADDDKPKADDDKPKADDDKPKADDDKPGKPKDEPKIPKSRFDEVNERRKAAEEKLAQRDREDAERRRQEEGGKKPAEPEYDFDAKELEYQEALLDGRKEDASAIRREMRQAEQDYYVAQAREQSESTAISHSQKTALRSAVVDSQAEYPELDGESESFNKEMSDDAIDLYEGYLASDKYTPAEAMQRAVNRAARMYGVKPLSQRAEPEPEPEADPPKDDRTAEDVEKKVEAANRQPPNPGTRTGQVEGLPDIMTMSEKEFDQLPEEEVRKLRGDA